jgi:hypothetical protein
MQLTLIFFQGIDLTESAISEGQYLKAAAMLRQDQGILARLQELSSASTQDGRLPSLKNSPPGTNRFLDHFNTTTPFPKTEFDNSFLKDLSLALSGRTTTFPATNVGAVHGLYELHIRLLFSMVRELMILYTEMYNNLFQEDEFQQALDFLYGVVETLEEIGIRFEKPGNS